jgi:hypothetical protein
LFAAVGEVRLGLGLGLGFGLAAAGLASALAALAALSFAVFASLFPAMTGAAVMATTSRHDNQLLTFIDGVLLVHRSGAAQACVQNMGGNAKWFLSLML